MKAEFKRKRIWPFFNINSRMDLVTEYFISHVDRDIQCNECNVMGNLLITVNSISVNKVNNEASIN